MTQWSAYPPRHSLSDWFLTFLVLFMEHRGLLLQVFEWYVYSARSTDFMYQAQDVSFILETGASEKDFKMCENHRMYAAC